MLGIELARTLQPLVEFAFPLLVLLEEVLVFVFLHGLLDERERLFLTEDVAVSCDQTICV